MLEAWRLAKDPRDFVDRELFIQCERIVEANHGQAIHDMTDIRGKNRNFGWQDDEDGWDEDENEWGDADDQWAGQRDGFLGLDDDPLSPREPFQRQVSPTPWPPLGRDGFEGLEDIPEARRGSPDPGRRGSPEPARRGSPSSMDGRRGSHDGDDLYSIVGQPQEQASIRDTPISRDTPMLNSPTPPPPKNPFGKEGDDKSAAGSWAARRRMASLGSARDRSQIVRAAQLSGKAADALCPRGGREDRNTVFLPNKGEAKNLDAILI